MSIGRATARALAAAVFAVCWAAPGAAAESAAARGSPFYRAYQKAAPGTVRVVCGPMYSSGLIVSDDGLVVTHYDVIKKNEVSVAFAEGPTAKAKLLVRDEKTKLAVVQILPEEAKKDGEKTEGSPAEAPRTPPTRTWKPVLLGSSDRLTAGSWVATVAYPVGADMKAETEPSLSAGVLMARGRIPTKLAYEGDLLVTDAMTNQGSEGGALIDAEGTVVGVLVKPEHHRSTDTALNLALPVELVAGLLKRARESPDAPMEEIPLVPSRNQGFLGVKSTVDEGPCRVHEVVEGGPADKAGIRAGDIITKVAGKSVRNYPALVFALKATKPGDKVTLTVRREGKEKEFDVEVTLGEYPKQTDE